MEAKIDLNTFELKAGSHGKVFNGEACFIEAASVYHGEPFGDRNVDNFCPIIEAYGRALNDSLSNVDCQRLKVFIPRLKNTKGTREQDEQKRWMLQEFTMECAVSVMDVVNLVEEAETLRKCLPIVDEVTSKRATAAAKAVAEAAEAARAAWAARAARAAWAAEAEIVDKSIDLLDRLIRVTESKSA